MQHYDFKNKISIISRANAGDVSVDSLGVFEQAAAAKADFIETPVRETRSGGLMCSVASGRDVALDEALDWSKDRVPLVLEVVNGRPGAANRVLNAARRHNVQDHVVLAVHSVRQTREITHNDENVTILGMLAQPQDYPAFYKAGGHIARLWEGDLTPGNLRVAENGVGSQRRPVWAMAGFYPNERIRKYGEADLRDLFSMMSKGVRGVIVNDAGLAREALCQRQAPQPACGSFAVD